MKALQLMEHFFAHLFHLQHINIQFIVTGTVAINLQGLHTGRDPEDLDIVTTSNFDYTELGYEKIWGKESINSPVDEDYSEIDSYINEAIWQKKWGDYKINILVLAEGSTLTECFLKYRGFLIEPLDKCLEWKRKLNRLKDIEDIKSIKLKYFKNK